MYGFDPKLIKINEDYQKIINYGSIAA
ncbi:MAG: hypothetical protein ACJA01_003031 [Saprospiraceae bacterium]